ncbi:major facilitator superfamily transporter [Phlyctema vagabunda]|uniref:Major facilitator superfamily transporter n=1 Tax=Phlyctema vagabunda TaxID=108571 RepID=A0ABR4PWD6_9HELO
MAVVEETAPLLGGQRKNATKNETSIVPRILFCGFVISLSLSFTWVPIIYVFRVMTCEEYYNNHPPYTGTGDQCSIPAIEAATAQAVALLGTTTTIFGVMNLIWAGWTIKRFGVKIALIQQTLWPVLRLCCQIIAVTVGGNRGILIFQVTQCICVLGGPSGYLLALNTFATEVTEPARRTAVYGKLQGAVMFGVGGGYLLGGLSGDIFGIRRPFEIAFFLMIFSTIYSSVFLPSIATSSLSSPAKESTTRKNAVASFFGPAKLFVPPKITLANGKTQRYWGVFFLGAGVFWGVLATGYIPILIQMYATNAFGFHPTENGYLMSFNSMIRGCFLTFFFPKIIEKGRRWFESSSAPVSPALDPKRAIPIATEDFEVIAGLEAEQEPTLTPIPVDLNHGSAFDLFFLKWSLVIDGILTGSAAFSRKGWHIYVAAFLLPLASGSAPAAKGVMMEMCEPEQRADALSAITLVEMIATLSTVSVFGMVFSALAEIGKPYLVFVVNAGIAVFAVLVLAFSRFRPKGSRTYSGVEREDEVNHEVNATTDDNT